MVKEAIHTRSAERVFQKQAEGIGSLFVDGLKHQKVYFEPEGSGRLYLGGRNGRGGHT